jgi:hypothetical protein
MSESGMKRLIVLGLFMVAVACAPQPPPPAPPPAPPAVAAAPPPTPAPPLQPAPPPTPASLNGHYSGLATLGVSGVESRGTTNPICVDRRPISMTISNGYATIVYQDWKLHTLHYRGRVDPSGKIYLSHLNGDGSRSVFTLHPSPEGWNGDMRRGNCEYMIALARS